MRWHNALKRNVLPSFFKSLQKWLADFGLEERYDPATKKSHSPVSEHKRKYDSKGLLIILEVQPMSYSDVNLVCFACKTHPALKTTQPCYVAISDKQPRRHLQYVILIQFLYDLTRRQRTMSEHALTQSYCWAGL